MSQTPMARALSNIVSFHPICTPLATSLWLSTLVCAVNHDLNMSSTPSFPSRGILLNSRVCVCYGMRNRIAMFIHNCSSA